MHPNPAFRPDDHTESLALAREWGFGMLAVPVPDAAPLLSHIPFLVSDDGTSADLHLVRSNPITRTISAPVPARIAVQGPHGYVSPDWYGVDNQVPTWNYIAIHLTGTLVPLPAADLPDMLERLSTHFERQLSPKQVWTLDKLDADARDRMLRQIAPFRFAIDTIDSTWKLGQNKPDSARLSAADHLAAHNMGSETRLLSALMRKPPL